jgi:hypothetical protein
MDSQVEDNSLNRMSITSSQPVMGFAGKASFALNIANIRATYSHRNHQK